MPTIELPAGFVASSTLQISTLFSSFSGVTILIIGLLGVSTVITIFISALHGHK